MSPAERQALLDRFQAERFFPSHRDPFSALRKARVWLGEQGITAGPVEKNEPIGLVKGTRLVKPWSKLTTAERDALDGVILCASEIHGFANGGALVRLHGAPMRAQHEPPRQEKQLFLWGTA